MDLHHPIVYKSTLSMKDKLEPEYDEYDHLREHLFSWFIKLQGQPSTFGEFLKEFERFETNYYDDLPPAMRKVLGQKNMKIAVQVFDVKT